MAYAEKLKIGAAAIYIGQSIDTLRDWHRLKKLIPAYIQPNGYRLYTREQLDEFLDEMAKRAKAS